MMEDLIEKLLRVEGNRPDSLGICTQWHRNPEGPEAVALIETTRAELAASKERERETLAVLQTAHESESALVAKLSATDAALREALDLMRGEPDMSLRGSDHWVWAEKVRELIGEGEPT